MSRVVGDITISLDGFVTGPGADPEHGLGRGAEDLHAWVWSGDATDRAVLEEATAQTGAVVMGRALFVVTSSEPDTVRLASTHDLTFVLDGPAAAVGLARPAAGERDVVVMGGAAVIRGCLEAGLLDELRLHLAPVVLGAGTSLFDGATHRVLVQRDVRVSPNATHLTYVVAG